MWRNTRAPEPVGSELGGASPRRMNPNSPRRPRESTTKTIPLARRPSEASPQFPNGMTHHPEVTPSGEKTAYSTNASGSVRIVGHSENPRAAEGSVLVSCRHGNNLHKRAVFRPLARRPLVLVAGCSPTKQDLFSARTANSQNGFPDLATFSENKLDAL